MRVNSSAKNIIIGVISQIVIIFLGFVSRKVFIDSLGAEYLGINGLLTNVLSMLALVESGIGASIIYSLYKPLANNDKSKVIALIQLFKKAYAIIAVGILILSIIIYPLVIRVMDVNDTIPSIEIVYLIFVLKNIVTYLNAHKVSLINADQKGYIVTTINIGFQIIVTLIKIFILIKTQNFLLYLIIELFMFIGQSFYISIIVNKRYPYIKTTEKYPLDKQEKLTIKNNVKALFLHNIGSFCIFGTDNILISAYVGLVTVGLYSNYTMILGQLNSLISSILDGIGSSVGNLLATESTFKSYSIFKVIYLINFWICSISVIFLYNLVEPFINWWIGKGYLLDSVTFIILLINFYITGMRSSIFTFKSKAGIFVKDKYFPLVEAAINLVISIILVKTIGLAGIFLGTTISTLSTVFWNVPRLVYKDVFHVSLILYFTKYLYYFGITLITCVITTYFSNLIEGENIFSLIKKGFICLTIPNLIYLIIFYKSKEVTYIKSILLNITSGLKMKLNSRTF
ncbi:hypothetical protein QUF86_19000 [Peribacillus sp. NJ11]|uniref:lipopolysaccharide biosynthesis protein n=1 Tax=Peribacillus sp. NJ11 TaxID=3055861 RepID=UPI0025A11A10|nr:hypothetical protein [Peribacillus sp. NJ11]MDM5222796.1 hypothetical protein [Peribacillus sp. NJ11]